MTHYKFEINFLFVLLYRLFARAVQTYGECGIAASSSSHQNLPKQEDPPSNTDVVPIFSRPRCVVVWSVPVVCGEKISVLFIALFDPGRRFGGPESVRSWRCTPEGTHCGWNRAAPDVPTSAKCDENLIRIFHLFFPARADCFDSRKKKTSSVLKQEDGSVMPPGPDSRSGHP